MSVWKEIRGKWTQAACELEVLSPKPGNVHPGQNFDDASVDDFLRSARAIAPVMALAPEQTLGQTILQAVKETRRVVSHNTNLGIILLIAPLAKVPMDVSLIDGIEAVLSSTTVEDSCAVYEAIRIASPGGLGNAESQDVNAPPSETLLECMKLAADRDMIARQYATGFRDVLTTGLEWLLESSRRGLEQKTQVTALALRLLATFPDSLILRRCGEAIAKDVQRLATDVMQSGWPESDGGREAFQSLDRFLREDGHRRNPGTTADFVAAILFAAQRERGYTIQVR